MTILITENQVDVLRRLHEIGKLVDYVIDGLNDDIKRGGPGNKPDNFGVYENWVTQRVSRMFKQIHPDIDFDNYDFRLIVSGQHNDELRKGFNKVRKRK
jgi:hypothetical protein